MKNTTKTYDGGGRKALQGLQQPSPGLKEKKAAPSKMGASFLNWKRNRENASLIGDQAKAAFKQSTVILIAWFSI
jgi:hypothetical protein